MSSSFDDLASLCDYLSDNEGKIGRLRQEIEEIHKGFVSEFAQHRENWESALTNTVDLAEDHFEDLPEALRTAVDQRLPTLRQQKAQRLQESRDRVKELETERAGVEKEAQETTEAVKAANPRLNEREEQLKATLASERARLAEIDAQLAQAAGGLGWLLRFARIRHLRRERKPQAAKVGAAATRLDEVRRLWVETRTTASERETRCEEAWRLRTAEIAKSQQEIEELEDDFEGACLREALRQHFTELTAPLQSGLAELEQEWNQAAGFRQETQDYEGGVVAVSQIVGLLGGVAEGMGRFRESVEGVKKEQDMHAELSHLQFAAPDFVLQFDQIWDALWPTVQDEKAAISHPAEFAKIIQDVIGSRLTNEQIEAYFNTLGDTLNSATKAWG